jgi:hypothetical protein
VNRAGFPRADIDVGFYHDPKINKLARHLRDPSRTMVCLGLYQSLILASWADGERVTLDDAAPAWWLDPLGDVAAELEAVGLVDAEGRIPEHAWETWFGPARDARRDRKFEGAIGGLIRSGMSREEAVAEAQRRRDTQGPLEPPSADPRGSLNPEHPPGRPTPPTGPAGRGSSSPTPLRSVVDDLVRDADEPAEDATCAVCGDALTLEPFRTRKSADGRFVSVHDRCYTEAKAVSA